MPLSFKLLKNMLSRPSLRGTSKDFVDRTTLPVLTPTEYLAQQEANNAK